MYIILSQMESPRRAGANEERVVYGGAHNREHTLPSRGQPDIRSHSAFQTFRDRWYLAVDNVVRLHAFEDPIPISI